jgi:hypothetical protein
VRLSFPLISLVSLSLGWSVPVAFWEGRTSSLELSYLPALTHRSAFGKILRPECFLLADKGLAGIQEIGCAGGSISLAYVVRRLAYAL